MGQRRPSGPFSQLPSREGEQRGGARRWGRDQRTHRTHCISQTYTHTHCHMLPHMLTLSHVHTHSLSHKLTVTHIHLHTSNHTYMHSFTCIGILTVPFAHIHTVTQTHSCMLFTCTFVFTDTRLHSHVYICTHTCTHTHTPTHSHTLACSPSGQEVRGTKAALVSEGLDKAAHGAHTLGILGLIHRCPEVLTLIQRTVLPLEGHSGTS